MARRFTDGLVWALLLVSTLGCKAIAELAKEGADDETESEDDDRDKDDEDEDEEEEEEEEEEEKDEDDDRPPPPPPPPPAAVTFESTGVPECDQYLNTLVACTPQAAANVPTIAENFRKAAQTPAARSALSQACTRNLDALKRACPGVADAPPPVSAPTVATPTTPTSTPPPGPALTGRPYTARSKPTRKEAPKDEEWASAPAEAVQGASDAGCTVKKLEPWVQVRCPGALGLELVKKDGTTVTTAQVDGAPTLVMKLEEGARVQARVYTPKGVFTFDSIWPKGAPEPAAAGTFTAGKTSAAPARPRSGQPA